MAFEIGQMDLHLGDDFFSFGELYLEVFVFLREELVLAVEGVVGEGQLIALLLETGLRLSE